MIAMFYAAPKQIYCNIKFMQLRHEKSCLHDGNIARRTPHDNINLDPNISNQPLQHSEKTYSMGPPPRSPATDPKLTTTRVGFDAAPELRWLPSCASAHAELVAFLCGARSSSFAASWSCPSWLLPGAPPTTDTSRTGGLASIARSSATSTLEP